ncbi:MAG: prepilin-type N-terminal cleavage/methylation domain-containing protein [Acidimicrobiia bacterium]|nr:prepilin-type N-terminal cleavage/methylation domain-containing protein [Acidimicrobiia bacterium]
MTDPEPTGESGMTLVEIMIAIVIMSVVVVGVLALLATLVRASDLSNRKTEAETTAIAAADYLKASDFDYSGAGGCEAHYATELAAYTTVYPTPGFTTSVHVYRGDAASISAGAAIATPDAGTPCLDGSTPVLRLSVEVTADDGAVSRSQDVVLRCDPAAAKAAGGTCL